MKKILTTITLIGFLALWGCGSGTSEGHDDHEGHNHEAEGHNHEAEGEGHEGHDHGAEAGDEIVIEPEKAEKFGIRTLELAPAPLSDAYKVSGQVLAPSGDNVTVTARSSGILHLNPSLTVGSQIGAGSSIGSVSAQGMEGGSPAHTAQVEAQAAKRALDRLKPLYADGLVTRAEYEAALSAYETAKARSGSAQVSPALTSPAAGIITALMCQDGQYVAAGTPVATVTKQSSRLTLRADLPQRLAGVASSITTARFLPAGSQDLLNLQELNGRLISAPKNAGPVSTGYIPIYFSFDAKNRPIVAGSYADVYLIGQEKADALAVPIKAVTESQGIKYVYVQIDEEGYEKRPVTLGPGDGINVEILSGVSPGEKVVTEGVTFVKLAETKAVPEGHTHNH